MAPWLRLSTCGLYNVPYLFKYNAHSCITRTLNFLIEIWYKLFFMLQHFVLLHHRA